MKVIQGGNYVTPQFKEGIMKVAVDIVKNSFQGKVESADLIPLEFIAEYSGKDLLYIDKETGILRSELSHSPQAILDYWSNCIFESSDQEDYSAANPFAQSRLLYVLLTLKNFLNQKLDPVSLCDFATGQGYFLDIAKLYAPDFKLTATEDSSSLCLGLRSRGYDVVSRGLGVSADSEKILSVDDLPNVGTLSWTLCNCIDPIAVLSDIYRSLAPEAYLCVAESSRILVPFRKSLHDVIPKKHPQDVHPFYFSIKSLGVLLDVCGFQTVFINRYFDSDILMIIAQKKFQPHENDIVHVDAASDVLTFMNSWHEQSIYFETIRKLL